MQTYKISAASNMQVRVDISSIRLCLRNGISSLRLKSSLTFFQGAEFGNASSICTGMYCRDPSTANDCVLHTAARGTSCGSKQVRFCLFFFHSSYLCDINILAHRIRISACFTWTDNFYLTHVISPGTG